MTYEYEAKTEKEAIEMAAAELGLEKDQFDVEILETQKNTIFKKGYARIRVHTDDSLKPAATFNSEEKVEKKTTTKKTTTKKKTTKVGE